MAEIFTGVSAFVLAGGRSSRMGTNKALLELAGKPLIERAISLARSVTAEVQIVGDPELFKDFGTVVPDIYPSRGPLGGIHAALQVSRSDLNLVMGVDLPLLDRAFLSFLISTAHSSETIVTVPHVGGHMQTLCSVYRRAFATVAEKALVAGRNKIDTLFTDVSVRRIEEHEIVSAGFTPSMFRNVNTRDEWESARREFEAAGRL